MELHGAVVGGLEFGETLAEVLGAVGYVLHDVGREPEGADAELFVVAEDEEALVNVLHAVVYAGEYVRVPVREALEKAGADELFLKKAF